MLLTGALFLWTAPASIAQGTSGRTLVGVASVVTVSDDSVDRLRLDQLIGLAPTAQFLIRSSARLMAWDSANSFRLVLPRIDITHNSAVPFGENDGALWAGRGANLRAIAGIEASLGAFRLVLLPEYVTSANQPFAYTQIVNPPLPAARKPFSSPWNVFPYSIDAPIRFGGGRYTRVSPGQSSVSLTLGPVAAGAATENEWWGPGIRTAILMSDNAEGFPRFFIRSARPLTTRLGTFEANWTWGGLTESGWFDFDPTNNLRSLSAIVGTWSPRFEPDLTIGFGRSVFAPATGWGQIAARPFDAFISTGRPNARSISDTTFRPGRDQLFSLFARWVFPANGFETYAEWARAEMPKSFRDFLLAPNQSQGYTIGLQWTRAAAGGRVNFQAEHSYLEQSSTFRNRPQGSFYTSRAVIQGYTNRGQVIGAAMGQGSSGEWIAANYAKTRWEFGTYAWRTRFNDDAYYVRSAPVKTNCEHDVTVAPGVRGSVRTSIARITLRYAVADRMNAFFQNLGVCRNPGPGVDRHNGTLSIGITTGP